VARAPFDLRAGERVAGYTIDRAIGRGGSASVYRASHASLAEQVAFKVMHEHDPSGVGRPRFAREAALLKKLDHPHVVKMIDYGFTEAGLPYIVFELLRGRSLYAAIKRFGAFDPARAGRIALQLLEALGAAHEVGIIHRDIKPGNVYLCAGHDEDYAKLLDLGLAKALEGDGPETDTITGTGYRLGTPRYMSPEMARGQKVGAQGDLYALGLVLAEMISGEPVVKGNVQVDVLMAHGGPTPLSVDAEVAASPFANVIERALAKPLDVRYRTALQMHADIEAALAFHERALQVARMVGDYQRRQGTADLQPTLALEDPAELVGGDADGSETDELPPEGDAARVEEAPTTQRIPEAMTEDAGLPAPVPAASSSAAATQPMVRDRIPPGPSEGWERGLESGATRPAIASRRTGLVLVALALVALAVLLGWLGSGSL